MKAYKAYGKAGHVTRGTPRGAAEAYFAEFPTSRKCSVIEGETDGRFFVTTYGPGKTPFHAGHVTKKQAADLPA